MADPIGGNAKEQLRGIIERIERLEAEKASLAGDVRTILAEARGAGFDTKTIRAVIRERKMQPSDRAEREQLLDLYRHALGMLADTPLGEAALRKVA